MLAVTSIRRAVPRGALSPLLRRVDGHLLLTSSIAAIGLLAALLYHTVVDVPRLLSVGGALLAAQIALGPIGRPISRRLPKAVVPTLRLAVSLGLVWALVQAEVDDRTLPLNMLYIPVVAMAAAIGRREALAIGGLALVLYLAPQFLAGPTEPTAGIRGLGLVGTTALLAVGTLRTVAGLRRTTARMRRAVAANRRRAGHMRGVEQVSALLARNGPAPEVLDQILAVLTDRFGYRFVSIYLPESGGLRMGAQRGYDTPIEWFDGSSGVMSRVLRTGEVAFVSDVSRDPDYRSASGAVQSEISAPLLDRGVVTGILNVESAAEERLDDADVRVVVAVADRLAAAYALAREREQLAERAARMRSLVEFSAIVSHGLEADDLHRAIVDSTSRVVPAELVGLTTLDPPSGRYFVRAVRGGSPVLLGAEILPGEGMAGRAIKSRSIAHADDYERRSFPAAVREATPADRYAVALGVPLVRDGEAVGALTLGRVDGPAFTSLDLEALDLLGAQAALVLSNAFLHADIARLAIHDALTGLHNRRYFDSALNTALAGHLRLPAEVRPPLSAVLFDLDHFGLFNKDHGHQIGDEVLRRFAAILGARHRASDIVARYGGEEFVWILVGTGRDDAERLANEILVEFAAVRIPGSDGRLLGATVSAGVAELSPTEPTRQALLGSADVGLAMAKRSGRNRVVCV